MRLTDIPDLSSPEFAPIRARPARLYFEHKADLGAADASDEDILQRVGDITLIMLNAVGRALLVGDDAFLERNRWFTDVAEDLLADRPAKLDR